MTGRQQHSLAAEAMETHTNQPTNQPTHPPNHPPTHPPASQPANQPNNQPNNQEHRSLYSASTRLRTHHMFRQTLSLPSNPPLLYPPAPHKPTEQANPAAAVPWTGRALQAGRPHTWLRPAGSARGGSSPAPPTSRSPAACMHVRVLMAEIPRVAVTAATCVYVCVCVCVRARARA